MSIPYTKTVWNDEVLAGAERFDIKDNVGTMLHENVQIALKTIVTTAGTSIDAAVMNNIEDAIEALAAMADDRELVYLKVFWHDEDVVAGDGKIYFTVPPHLAGGSIVDLDIAIIGASSSGLVTVQMANCGANPQAAGTDILSTLATIDVGEFNSMTAAAQPVIANPLLASGDILRVDVDVAGTGAKGLDIFFTIQRA